MTHCSTRRARTHHSIPRSNIIIPEHTEAEHVCMCCMRTDILKLLGINFPRACSIVFMHECTHLRLLHGETKRSQCHLQLPTHTLTHDIYSDTHERERERRRRRSSIARRSVHVYVHIPYVHVCAFCNSYPYKRVGHYTWLAAMQRKEEHHTSVPVLERSIAVGIEERETLPNLLSLLLTHVLPAASCRNRKARRRISK